MKTIVAIVSFAALASAQERGALNGLGFLAGCWEARLGALVIEEQWMRPLGGVMLGVGRTVKGDKAVHTEFLALRESGGEVNYIAHPSQNPSPTAFRMIKTGDGEAVFENPKHDFPQKISYRRLPDGSLLAQIEGVQGGKPRAETFPYRRVRCPE
jgi:hypothetical protein